MAKKDEVKTEIDMRTKKMAVAYLLNNTDKAPEGSLPMFAKLSSFENEAKAVADEIDKRKKEIEELTSKLDFKIGSLEGIAELIADILPEDKCEEWAAGLNKE